MTDAHRDNAVHAVDTLNDLVGDFVGGVMLLREWGNQFKAGRVSELLLVNVQKICLSHVVLGLCKFVEFYERFRKVIPFEHREICKALVSEIKQKGVVEFRNKCVGHIWDTNLNRPLIHSEIMTRINRFTGDNLSGFLDWINNPNANIFPSTVVSIIETVRDALMSQHAITPDEIINR
jgi:hypothetical protein